MTHKEAITWLKEMQNNYVYSDPYYLAIDIAVKALSADVRENVRGEWIQPEICLTSYPAQYQYQCSVCGYKYIGVYKTNFCPNCGAEMSE